MSKLLIYFGNSENSIHLDCYKSPEGSQYLEFIQKNKDGFKLENIIFAKQIHGTQGLIITDKLPDISKDNSKNIYNSFNLPKSWEVENDYLITDLKSTGIGVLTADCLPIIIIDEQNLPVISVIHAGWKGAVSGIIEACINNAIKNFGSKPDNLKAYLGPCAKICCYEVQNDFVSKLPKKYSSTLFFNANNKIYFDLPKLAQIKLENLGFRPENIDLKNNICTMCEPNFCSYRNDKNCKRQISLVAIKNFIK